MRTPRYNHVPVFGDQDFSTGRRAANYGGLLRCLWLSVLTVMLLLITLSCLSLGLFLLYPLDPPAATNILIVGVDTRLDSDESVDIGRTDAIMVLSIDPQREQISLLSIPRDLILNSPAYGRLRANTVSRNAELQNPGSGMDEMRAAVENTFDIQIDHYMRLDFAGFVEVIDSMGGIEIEVPTLIVDSRFPLPDDNGITTLVFEPGLQWMDGDTALKYARTRQADSDYARASRQQQVIEAMMAKFNEPGNLFRLPMMLYTLEGATYTDLGFDEVLRYLPGVLRYSSNGLQTFVITPEYTERDGTVTLPNLDALRPWLDDHLVHDAAPAAPSSLPAP